MTYVSRRCVPDPTDVPPTVLPLRSFTLLTLSLRSPRTTNPVPGSFANETTIFVGFPATCALIEWSIEFPVKSTDPERSAVAASVPAFA